MPCEIHQPANSASTTKNHRPTAVPVAAVIPMLRKKPGDPLVDNPIAILILSEVAVGKALVITDGKPFEKHPKKKVAAIAIFAPKHEGGEAKG